MPDTLPALIDKNDSFEIVRDQIAQILADNSAAQEALAIADGKNPDDWKLRVYAERSNPWETVLNSDDTETPDRSPIINVWYNSGSFPQLTGDTVEKQKCEGIFNVDVYGFGVSSNDPAGGHVPGDKNAALEAHRATKFVRNILMAAQNTYLQLRGLVWFRWIQSVDMFQPEQDAAAAQKIQAARLALRVDFTEWAPQFEGNPLETVNVDVKRGPDGLILATARYEYPL